MRNQDILCVITGMEHSGTTYLSKLLASNPDIMCGFECGILLDEINRFSSVDPWYDWMQESTDNGHWGVCKEDMVRICSAKNYYEAYHLIKKYAGKIGNKTTKKSFSKAKYIIDKTPRYAYFLDQVIEKIDVPFIVIKKNIFDLYQSYKKRDCPLHVFIQRYLVCAANLNEVCQKYPNRVLVVDYEDLIQDDGTVLKKIYQFLNIPFYRKTSLNEFFKKTGLKENTFVNEYGGMPINFDSEVSSSRLSCRENLILRNVEHRIIKPGLLRRRTIRFLLLRIPLLIHKALIRIYRCIAGKN